MPNLPTTFKKSGETPLVNYSFTDIASGTGLIAFYAATTKEETTAGYILTESTNIYSNDEQTYAQMPKENDTTFRKQLDYDFDLSPFHRPMIFEGTAYVNVTFGVSQSSTSDSNGCYLILKIRKWDGSTETDIVTAQTETWNDDKGSTYHTSLIPMTIPKTHFKVGETLRFTVELWTMLDSSISTVTYFLKHDPANRSGTAANPNVLRLQMPQDLDL